MLFFSSLCRSEIEECAIVCVSEVSVFTCVHMCGGVITLLFGLIVDQCPEGEVIIDGTETFSDGSLITAYWIRAHGVFE